MLPKRTNRVAICIRLLVANTGLPEEWTVVWLLRSLMAQPVPLSDPVRIDE